MTQNNWKSDTLKNRVATLKEDFNTNDDHSSSVLIKKGSKVFIKGNESDGTCYAEYLDFGFSINANQLSITKLTNEDDATHISTINTTRE